VLDAASKDIEDFKRRLGAEDLCMSQLFARQPPSTGSEAW
jgi:hypothetical protein